MRSASDLFSINCHLFTLNPITNLSQRKTLFQKFSFFKIIKINTTTDPVTLTANRIPSKIDGFWILWIFQNGTVLLIFYLFWCIIYALCIGGNCGCCCNLIIFILFFFHNMRYDRSISKRNIKKNSQWIECQKDCELCSILCEVLVFDLASVGVASQILNVHNRTNWVRASADMYTICYFSLAFACYNLYFFFSSFSQRNVSCKKNKITITTTTTTTRTHSTHNDAPLAQIENFPILLLWVRAKQSVYSCFFRNVIAFIHILQIHPYGHVYCSVLLA